MLLSWDRLIGMEDGLDPKDIQGISTCNCHKPAGKLHKQTVMSTVWFNLGIIAERPNSGHSPPEGVPEAFNHR